jgi:hypothetical protein
MMTFFLFAFWWHGGEAALLLLYHRIKRRFRWLCPEQAVRVYEDSKGYWHAGSDVEYVQPYALPPGYILFGDAHSHAALPAYASHLDKSEEHYKDGLHIVAGRLDEAAPDFHADFVIDGRRFNLDPDEIFEKGDRCRPYPRAPQGWVRQIRLKKYGYKRYW